MKAKKLVKISAIFLGMLALIVDNKTAIEGARMGITLCLRSVIPSLLPFIFLANAILSNNEHINRLQATRKWISKYPSIYLAGYLGGYPTGAQCAIQAYRSKKITIEEANKLIVVCNNPGPAFIFGIVAQLFTQRWIPWILWGIQIISSLIISCTIPNSSINPPSRCLEARSQQNSLIRSTLESMGIICVWVILFRTLIYIMQRWILWLLPDVISYFICGFLEITNGCIETSDINCVGLRFMLCAFFLGFGGICTVMQTYSLGEDIDCSGYWSRKLFQGVLSMLQAYFLQKSLLPANEQFSMNSIHLTAIFLLVVTYLLFLRKIKKISRISALTVV